MNIWRDSKAYHFDPKTAENSFKEFDRARELMRTNNIESVEVVHRPLKLFEGKFDEDIHDPQTDQSYMDMVKPLPSGNEIRQLIYDRHKENFAARERIAFIFVLDTQGNVYVTTLKLKSAGWEVSLLNVFLLDGVVKMENRHFLTQDGHLFSAEIKDGGFSVKNLPIGRTIRDFAVGDDITFVIPDDNTLLGILKIGFGIEVTDWWLSQGFAKPYASIPGYIVVQMIPENVRKVCTKGSFVVILTKDRTIIVRLNDLKPEFREDIIDIENKFDNLILLRNDGYVGIFVNYHIRWIDEWGGDFQFRHQSILTKSARF